MQDSDLCSWANCISMPVIGPVVCRGVPKALLSLRDDGHCQTIGMTFRMDEIEEDMYG
jgi:hypothetical protein